MWRGRSVLRAASPRLIVPRCAGAPSGRQTRFWEGGKGQRDLNKLVLFKGVWCGVLWCGGGVGGVSMAPAV